MRKKPYHVHLENFSTKPPVFHLTPELVEDLRKRHKKADRYARFTVGDDLAGLAENLKSAHILVTSNDVIRHKDFPRDDLAAAAPHLRLIHMIGAGVEGIMPLDWLPPKVRVTNNSGVHTRKAYEFFLMALVALNNRLPAIVTNQRDAKWEQIFTPRIEGKTVTVIGLGAMGSSAVRAARGLGMKVLGVRRSKKSASGVETVYTPDQIENAVAPADIVVVAAPLTPATRGLLSDGIMRAMKPGAGLVNTGRAGIVDYRALAKHLKSGRLGGAILDVYDPEPLPPSSPLWKAPNVILSPHVSSDDADAYMPETMELVYRNVKLLFAGKKILNQVRRDLHY